jgi:hypothetical protein
VIVVSVVAGIGGKSRLRGQLPNCRNIKSRRIELITANTALSIGGDSPDRL